MIPASLESSVVIIWSGETLEKVSRLSRDPVITTSSTSRAEKDGASVVACACSSSLFKSDCAPLCGGVKAAKNAKVGQQSPFVSLAMVASSLLLEAKV
jgi:hypothetical protein